MGWGWKGKGGGGGVPDRWEDYTNIGNVVEGTQFIPFKVPLNEYLLKDVSSGVEKWSLKDLSEVVPELGLVVDLTNTKRYYQAKQLEGMGIKYCKIFTKGHEVPDKGVVNKFYKALEDVDDGKIVGVHCTHGLNRTGYLICRFMVEKMGVEPGAAIHAFDAARGHKQERENYLEHIRSRGWERQSSEGGKEAVTPQNHVGDGRRGYHTLSGGSEVHDQNIGGYYEDYYGCDDYCIEYFQEYHPGYCYPFPVQHYTPAHGEHHQGGGSSGGEKWGSYGYQLQPLKDYKSTWVQGNSYRGSFAEGYLEQAEFKVNIVQHPIYDEKLHESKSVTSTTDISGKENIIAGELFSSSRPSPDRNLDKTETELTKGGSTRTLSRQKRRSRKRKQWEKLL